MKIKLNNGEKNFIKVLGVILLLGGWTYFLLFYGKQKPGLYEITLKSVFINGKDFNVDVFEQPLHISLSVYKDGKKVFKKDLGRVRGKKDFEHVYFKLTKSNKSKYQIKLEEFSVISKAVWYTYPGEPKEGYWFFNQKAFWDTNDKDDFNKNYVEFESKYLE